MTARPAGVIRTMLLIWTGVTFLPAWLVTVRGLFDGESYSWGVTGKIRGSGTGGYYPLAPLASAYGVLLLALGWRGPARPFHLLLALWHLSIGVLASVAARRNREALRFRGDTLGVDVSLGAAAPAALGGIAVGVVVLALIDDTEPMRPRWTSCNGRLIAIALAALPFQFALLRSGEPHGRGDKAGVLLTICQWIVLNGALALRER